MTREKEDGKDKVHVLSRSHTLFSNALKGCMIRRVETEVVK
jgi:hypothetical protein